MPVACIPEQGLSKVGLLRGKHIPRPTWIPAFAGMTTCGFRDDGGSLLEDNGVHKSLLLAQTGGRPYGTVRRW
jgi:hypothetical protein